MQSHRPVLFCDVVLARYSPNHIVLFTFTDSNLLSCSAQLVKLYETITRIATVAMIPFLDVTFTGYLAKFIKMQKEGYKVFVQPLTVDSLDLIYGRIKDIGICAMQLALGSRKFELHKALFNSSIDLDRFFSSGHVKNGGMKIVCLLDLLIYCCLTIQFYLI